MMFADHISMLPEFLLLCGMFVLLLAAKFRQNTTPKTYFTVSKIAVAAALLGTVVFYNQSFMPGWLINDSYTTLFKTLIYIAALASFYLGCKWFLNKNRSSLSFYLTALFSLLLLTLAVSAQNLLVLSACLTAAFVLNACFIRLHPFDEVSRPVLRRYLWGCLAVVLLWAASLLLFRRLGIPYDYAGACTYLEHLHRPGGLHYLAAVLLIVSLLYMLGIAPFHFWYADVLGGSVLPAGTYLTFIPPLAYLAVLVNLLSNVFFPLYGQLRLFLTGCAALSVILGVVGANSETNLRKLFAYVALFNLGIVLMCFSELNDNGLLSGFVCLLVWLLAQFGVYTVFYAFKRKGDYLTETADLAGLAEVRPYIAAAMLIFMVSLLGTPPMLGFLGKLSAINYLIIEGSYAFIGLILAALLLLAYAFLNVIKTIYFDARGGNTFDRADKGVYICLMVNLILVLISILNPRYLMHDAENILSTIL